MHQPPILLRRAIHPGDLLASVRAGAAVVALFVIGAVAARYWADGVALVLTTHRQGAMVLFVLSSAIAVLLPVLTNLPLLPFASLAWGPWWAAGLLLLGWVLGAMLSFALGRRVGAAIVRRFPSVQRYTDIDRLIHPRHRLLSLVLLRMTFPVDVLSYALGLFSRTTRARDNMVSTALGGAPFALLFAFVPVLPTAVQVSAIVASVLVFVVYAWWILGHPPSEGLPR